MIKGRGRKLNFLSEQLLPIRILFFRDKPRVCFITMGSVQIGNFGADIFSIGFSSRSIYLILGKSQ